MAKQVTNYDIDPSPILSMTLWKAIDVFGEEAVQAVVKSPEFAHRYPDLLIRLQSDELRTRYDTLLPAAVVLEIAGRDDCLYDFLEDPAVGTITAVVVGEPVETEGLRERGINRWVKLDRQEALRKYGGHSLWKAVDRGVGYEREHDYHLDWQREREALRLKVVPAKDSFVLPEPVLVEITLSNTGDFSIRVDRDLVLGYPDAPPGIRQLSFHLVSPSGDEIPMAVRSHLGFHRPEYTYIQPGQAITKSFDLLLFYEFHVSGRYRFHVSHRQASASDWIEFNVQRLVDPD